MKHKGKCIIICLVSILLILPMTNSWESGGSSICIVTNDQSDPQICTDGNEGAFIVWEDQRNESYDIFAQLIDASGQLLWDINGIAICTENGSQHNPQMCSDNSSGAIIVWQDGRAGDDDIYTQRINIAGTVLWDSNGTAICTVTGTQRNPQICSDGSGGAIIVWQDNRKGSYDIYAQRINSTGHTLWNANGTPICTATDDQRDVDLCYDGFGGVIVTWEDDRDVYEHVYTQRLNESGHPQWLPNGTAITTIYGPHTNPKICADGNGGAIITWTDETGLYGDIYAQRINASGSLLWMANGNVICDASSIQFDPQICSDGMGGAIVTWGDARADLTDSNIYVQKINEFGQVQWTANGILICGANFQQTGPQLCGDGAGGATVAWLDMRKEESGNYDLYAQKVSSSGAKQWKKDGVAVCTEYGYQTDQQLCDDGNGGAIIVWEDRRNGNHYDIYAAYLPIGSSIPSYTLLFLLLGLAALIVIWSKFANLEN